MASTRYAGAAAVALLCAGLAGCAGELAPGEARAEVGSCDALGQRVEAAFDAAVAGLPGAVAAVDARGCRFRLAAGVSDVTARTPMDPGDLFRVGSITKSFVATLVLMLRAEGRVSLDGPVSGYVGGVPGGDGMTVRQILNHTSGLYDFTENDAFWAKVAEDPAHRFAPTELLALAAAKSPYFAPGGGFHYSNTDYIVAGLLLEHVTGEPVGDLLSARILRPLGLLHTYLDGAEAAVPGLVRGYATDGAKLVDATSAADPSAAWTAGALVSTADDLTRFYQALAGGRVLAPAELQEMTTWVPTPWPDEPGYGLGLGDRRTALGPGWGHEGGIWGFIASSYDMVEKGASVTVLVNLETADVARIAEDLAKAAR